MIGQKIIKFDEAEKQDVATFKEVFNVELKGLPTDEVTLGEPVIGGLREVTVNGVTENLDLVDLGRNVVCRHALFKIRGRG